MPIAVAIKFTQGLTDPDPGKVILATVGVPVVCTNDDDAGVTGWSWSAKDVPQGTNSGEDSVISANTVLSTSDSLSITPDVPGAYRIQLQATDGSDVVTEVNTILVADEFGVIKPGFQSVANELDQGLARNRGWAQLRETIDSLVRKLAQISISRRETFYGVAGSQGTNFTGFTKIGEIAFDPSVMPAAGVAGVTRTIKFEAVVSVTQGFTAQVRLWNATDGLAVTDSVMTTTSESPELKVSDDLTVPVDLPNAEKLYEVQLRISAGGAPGVSDRALCESAVLKVRWE